MDASGEVANPQPIANVGSDSMASDCAGNLYVTQGGVRVYNPSGMLLGTLAAPGAANVAFGGPERKTLYITATTRLLAVELAIGGLPY
ncbi:MAG: SMP-30/gluconolactonase/LRE family protein [Deltaproteobacteria bacterium]